MSDFESEINDIFETLEEQTSKATKKAKKASKKETLAEAKQRILLLKWTDAEKREVETIFHMLERGQLTREDDSTKMSKKEIVALIAKRDEMDRERKRKHMIDTRPHNFGIVQTETQLSDMEALLRLEDEAAVDTETQGLDIFNHVIVGYSVYLPKADMAYYVPFRHTTGQQQVSPSKALDAIRWFLQDTSKRTFWHHYKYDGHMFANDGIDVVNPWWDTQVVSKLLDENEPSHRLKDLYAKYCTQGEEAILFEDLYPDYVIYDKDVVLAGIYACWDVVKTYRLQRFQQPFIDTRDNLKTVWYEIEQKLLKVDLDMERTGWRIDLERLAELEREFQPVLDEAHDKIISAFNINDVFLLQMSAAMGRNIEQFKVTSPDHLQYLLYDVLGVDPSFPLRFKQKERSTAASVIEALAKDDERLTPIMEFRKLQKLLSTYVQKIPHAMEPATGRLHSRFNNLGGETDSDNDGTATGRYSSSTYVSGKNSATGDVAKGTNLQNIPSKGIGVEIRKTFIPDDGWIIIGADLSQIEPRVIAHILATQYGDRAMLQAYEAGVDLYVSSAMRTFGFEERYCLDGAYDPTGTYQPRKLMKQGVLAFLYGQSARAFARTMKVSEEVAQTFFDGMLTAFVGLEPFRNDVLQKLMTVGSIAHVETLYGRKRRFPDYRKNKAELKRLDALGRYKRTSEQDERRNQLWRACASVERQAVNTIIQGTAADIIKMNMIELHKRWVVGYNYKLHASIHDEVLPSVPKYALTPELIEDLRDIMCNTVKLEVPLKTDIVIQERWMDETKPSDWDFENCCPKVA